MGIRRRRKKLTSLLSNMDRDIRSTTLRQVKRQTVVASDVTEEAETTTTVEPPVGTQIAVDPPDQWAKIIGGYYYPPLKTGGLGQVELFIDEDLQLSASEKMYVSGTEVKWNQTSGGKTYSGSFRPNTANYTNPDSTTIRVVSQYGNPSWSTRAASTKPVYASIPSGVTNSILYTVTNKDVIPNRVTLSFRGQVASYYATTTTATITFTAAHHFVAGHIVDVSSLGSPMQDIDGIVKITAVPSNTQISYEFTTPLASSITTTTPSTTSYVNAVVSKYTTIGSSWIDSSVVPNKVYIWDGLRWAGYTDALEDGLVTNDGIAPAAPTGLTLTTAGYNEDGVLTKVAKSSVTLSWTGPTTNASGGSLNDLAGYRIWYSTDSATGPWIGKQTFGQETSQTIIGLTPEITYYFKVIAYDSYGLDSDGLDGDILTEKAALSVDTPSAPVLTTRLGTIKATWDGKDNTGGVTPLSLLARLEVHYSTSSGFTPSSTTLLGAILNGAGYFIAADLEYETDYYFKFVAVDINNRSTSASVQATAKVLPLVDADLIAANLNSPLSVWPFAPKAVTAGALADGALDATTVFGPGVITQDAIAANAIGANQIAANAITAGKIQAGAVTAAKIEALAISADKIAANAITTDKIQAGSITTEKLVAGTLTGFTINTAGSGTRLELSGTSMYVYYGSTLVGVLAGTGEYGGELSLQNTSTNNGIYIKAGDTRVNGDGGYFFASSTDCQIIATDISFSAANWVKVIGSDFTVTGGDIATNLEIRAGGYVIASQYLRSEVMAAAATGTAYFNTNGTLTRSSSSIRYKQDVVPLEVDYDALISIEPKKYRLISEVESFGGKAAHYPGMLAEDLHEAGLIEFVGYEETSDGTTRPDNIRYAEFSAGLLSAIRHQDSLIKELQNEIQLLKGQ